MKLMRIDPRTSNEASRMVSSELTKMVGDMMTTLLGETKPQTDLVAEHAALLLRGGDIRYELAALQARMRRNDDVAAIAQMMSPLWMHH